MKLFILGAVLGAVLLQAAQTSLPPAHTMPHEGPHALPVAVVPPAKAVRPQWVGDEAVLVQTLMLAKLPCGAKATRDKELAAITAALEKRIAVTRNATINWKTGGLIPVAEMPGRGTR